MNPIVILSAIIVGLVGAFIGAFAGYNLANERRGFAALWLMIGLMLCGLILNYWKAYLAFLGD